MDQTLYSYSLCMALPLMWFFGFHMLFAPTPGKKIYSSFLRSRRLMGTALLLLSANYAVHFAFSLRLKDPNATILLNLATYFLCYWLFSSAMMTLLDNRYLSRRRTFRHLGLCLAFSAVACAVGVCGPHGWYRQWGTFALAAGLVVYGLFLSVRLLRTYRQALRMFEDTHSDDIGAYIRWLSVFTYWAIGFGVSCGLLTFLPDAYVFVWVLSSVPFYVYLYCCYQNYMLFYEKVENALQEDAAPEATDGEDAPAYHAEIARRIQEWISQEGYRRPGLTLNELAQLLCTNRTYLSEYIHSVYGTSFRDWISGLRIDYAKAAMEQHPRRKIQQISEEAGFLSQSHFFRTFSEKEGCSPARWRKSRME